MRFGYVLTHRTPPYITGPEAPKQGLALICWRNPSQILTKLVESIEITVTSFLLILILFPLNDIDDDTAFFSLNLAFSFSTISVLTSSFFGSILRLVLQSKDRSVKINIEDTSFFLL